MVVEVLQRFCVQSTSYRVHCWIIDKVCYVGILALAHEGTLQAPVMQQFQAIQPHHQGYAMPQAHGRIPVSPASQASFQMSQGQWALMQGDYVEFK